MAVSAARSSQVSPTKYPPGPPPNVSAPAHIAPHIPRHRSRITPAGWAVLAELAVWALIITAAVRWL